MIDKDDYMFLTDVYAPYVNHEYLKQHYQQIAQPFVEKVNALFTGKAYYEFNALGVHKQTALKTTFEQCISHMGQVIAFGDGHNDLEMIRHVGIGIAMENACN